MTDDADVRLDKWLWAARLFKTRALAAEAADRGRVRVNGQPARASRAVRPGDRLDLRLGGPPRELVVHAVTRVRGPAVQAQELYEETPDSLAARARAAEARRLAPEPAAAIVQGRPTKRDRRQLAGWHGRLPEADAARPRPSADWQRWSASLDDPHGGTPDDAPDDPPDDDS